MQLDNPQDADVCKGTKHKDKEGTSKTALTLFDTETEARRTTQEVKNSVKAYEKQKRTPGMDARVAS